MSAPDQQPLDRTAPSSHHTKDIATAQIKQAAAIGQEAVISGAYLYPFQGVYYILRHPHLWKPLKKPILYSFALSAVVTASLFTFTYLPQVALLAFSNGPLAFVTAATLVLGEAGTVTLFLAKALWLAPALDNIFDQILLEQGLTALVAEGREVQGQGQGKRLGKSLTAPLNRFNKEALVRYLLSLPLNSIPIVGTIFFLFYNGTKSGPSHHERYFQLKKFTPQQKKDFIASKRGSYTAFGTAAMALNLIPGAAIPFSFATTAGAALWACDIEKKSGYKVDTNASQEATQDVSDVGKKAD